LVRTAFAETLLELMAADERIWLVTGDLGFSVLEPFIERFPGRYVNAGVAEQNMTGVAAGLASCGHTVFTYSIANFPTIRCLEQVRNDVCYNGLNVKIVSVGGGFAYGPQGYTHHGLEDLAVMRTLPGMTVVAPGDPVETRLATRAVAVRRGPCYLRLGKAREPVVHPSPPPFQLGRAIGIRPGRDLTLISTGGILAYAVAVADRLRSAAGADARVLSMHTLKPLDEDAIAAAARETRAILTVEEHSIVGGLGSAVADVIATRGLGCKFVKWGAPDGLLHAVGSQDYLRSLCGDLFAAARELVSRK
jgi:transketolase